MGDWNQQLTDYLVKDQHKSCYAAALGGLEGDNFGLYAVAAVKGDWEHVHADPSERKIMIEDGSEKAVIIDEFASIKSTLEADLKVPGSNPHGLWIANVKYKVCTRDDDIEIGGQKVVTIHAKMKKKGVHIVKTKKSVLMGLYDEENKQNASAAGAAVHGFAKYLVENDL